MNNKCNNNFNIALIGYSGHSYVCAEVALLSGYKIVGYYDQYKKDLNPFNIDYLGPNEEIIDGIYNFLAIGNNTIREKLFYELQPSLKINLIHPKAYLSENLIIGDGNLVSVGAILNTFVKLGNSCIINSGAIVEHECIIESFTHIAPGAVLAGNVTIGQGSFIGANSVIKQGVKIGKNVTIGAGSVVINDIEDNKVYVGNPAKELIKNRL